MNWMPGSKKVLVNSFSFDNERRLVRKFLFCNRYFEAFCLQKIFVVDEICPRRFNMTLTDYISSKHKLMIPLFRVFFGQQIIDDFMGFLTNQLFYGCVSYGAVSKYR